MAVILASQSPRRHELLSRIISDFEVVPADIDEDVKSYFTPMDYVLTMAAQKAAHIAKQYPNDLVIGSDTIVTIDNEILGKPTSREDGFRMLRQLSGRTHKVYTSVVLMKDDQESSATVPATVEFYDLTDEEINRYLDTKEYEDKAGAYGIQEQGALLVKSIQGDYYSIMGLPIATLYRMLPSFDQC
ncbi:septum formation protein Maf [Enterococcus sp. 7E2_DIV0204]|uniref:dTTP/UTP pyrophosphatase n=1 Tax=Candidatus Enterococcus lemimoniae TaxID=1834167 RepID=A0ABZ2T7K4_9ENTE|nr:MULTISPECIES: Maf family protein [unclassified Enterococcus]OTN88574.1 septum formation protein Maf [Enterococcus sp. 7E2_DIV0204]OTO70733.1 septum formation protein Maf [Enterococcus sp. 12C11_DIV0727]OTP51043.1 septum formation protein Maf [Enterococcus sp. 7D2_DIV0200]